MYVYIYIYIYIYIYASSPCSPHSNPSSPKPLDALPAPPKDSTRGVSVTEVLFTMKGSVDRNNRPGPSVVASLPAAADTKTELHGRLSNGLDYAFELPPPSINRLFGRLTNAGWFVKAGGVCASVINEDVLAATGRSLQKHFLVSFMEGFVVKNKLVLESLIHVEFEDDDDRVDSRSDDVDTRRDSRDNRKSGGS
jgi:hypothetical protein